MEARPREETLELPQDLLDLYFQQLKQYPLLTAEEEVDLAKRIAAGEEAVDMLEDPNRSHYPTDLLDEVKKDAAFARERLVGSNLRLVIKGAAVHNKNTSMSLNDLIQEGNLGLLRAAEKFDYKRGYKFSTYATWWIRQAIQRGIEYNEDTIRLPAARHSALRRIQAATARLESMGRSKPSTEELAEATNLAPEQVEDALAHDYRMASLDKAVGDGGDSDSSSLGDFVAVEPSSVEDEAIGGVLDGEIHKLIDTVLDERERAAVLRHVHGKTLQNVADEYSLGRERVRQIERDALAKLRAVVDEGGSRAA